MAPGDRAGTVLCIPEMLGIPVIGLVAAGMAVVFGTESGATGVVGNVEATVGVTVIVGTATAELTPRLPISVEPIGMPVRGTPPGVVADVGADDAATLFEPAPHMLWLPDVSIRADVGEMPDEDIAIVPCGVTLPTAMPPPSKLADDPNIVDGAVPTVEHTVLPTIPVEGSGIGLTPGEVISVAPNGMPVPPTGALGTMPSGDVAASDGVGITAACWAKVGLHNSIEAVAIIRIGRIVIPCAGLLAGRAGRWDRLGVRPAVPRRRFANGCAPCLQLQLSGEGSLGCRTYQS